MKKIWQSAIQIILAASAGFVIGFILASSFPKQYLLASILIFIVSLFFIFPLAIIIHESGHLVMGLLTGYRFSSFRIGKILILKQNNHLKIKKFSISGTGGQCLLIPPSYRSNFPFLFYNAGGGIFNLLTAILVVVLINVFNLNYVIKIILITIGIVNGYLGLINLIPLIISLPNDGYNILSIIKDTESRYCFYAQLMISYLQTNNVRFQDMDDSLFEMPANANLNNPLNQFVLVAQIDRLQEQLKFDEAKILIEKILNECKLTDYYRNSLNSEYLFYLLMENANSSKVNDLYYEIEKFLKQSCKTNLSCQRTLYAYQLLAVKNDQEAQKYLNLFNQTIKTYPFTTIIETELKIIELIKEKYHTSF